MDNSSHDAFERLSDILDILRRDCPWDASQSLESLRYLTIEEVYELSEAILTYENAQEGNGSDVMKELGDLLMHVLFYAKIAADKGLFSFADVCHAVSDKLVKRHPHLALPLRDGTLCTPTSTDHPGWEAIKMQEGRRSVLEGVPKSLPTLIKSVRMQEKAAGLGYREPVDQPIAQLLDQLPSESDAVGRLLFAWIERLDSCGVNADEALSLANQRFEEHVRHWEEGQGK